MTKYFVLLLSVSLFLTSCKKEEVTEAISDDEKDYFVINPSDTTDQNPAGNFTRDFRSPTNVIANHGKFNYPMLNSGSPTAVGARQFGWLGTFDNISQRHSGSDLGVDVRLFGSFILASGSGRVVNIIKNNIDKSDRGLGNIVILQHQMLNGNPMFTLYGHLNSFASGISVGAYVPRGTLIGYQGQTANGESGGSTAGGITHLHFEMKNNNVIGHTPDCRGSGCVGYVRTAFGLPTDRGYYNPNCYFNPPLILPSNAISCSNAPTDNRFNDLMLITELPTTLRRSGSNSITVSLRNPFSGSCIVDLRLALYSLAGNYLGDIATINNQTVQGSTTNVFTFSRLLALTSNIGANYRLQLESRLVNSILSDWHIIQGQLTLNATSALFQNPRQVSIIP